MKPLMLSRIPNAPPSDKYEFLNYKESTHRWDMDSDIRKAMLLNGTNLDIAPTIHDYIAAYETVQRWMRRDQIFKKLYCWRRGHNKICVYNDIDYASFKMEKVD